MNQKFKYLLRSALRFFSPVTCPHCGGSKAHLVDRKYIVTRLFQCDQCYLQFRHPTDDKKFNKDFYQEDYTQEDGITTDLPSEAELKEMLSHDFKDSPKNVSHIVELWASLFTDLNAISVVDYGCSWGYMSYQFKQLGIKTQSFEISKPRAVYGNKHLSLDIQFDISKLAGDTDLVYSSHVIEHVPSVENMVDDARRLLKENGLFVAESPNGSASFREENEASFHYGWGLVHPNYLNDKFYQILFRSSPYFITSTPFDLTAIRGWDGKTQVTHRTNGPQLLIIAKPNVIL